ncbi:MAG: AmmeMemoRadiSam system protein B [Syntrophorhabdaceae bacterium]|nr:AmmeMemoRadiSam system protein B [Syntrophorhabdaceae bacterium]
MDRFPVVAGQFYPNSEEELSLFLKDITWDTDVTEKLMAIGVVAPHAGYVYSGAVAGEVFSSVHIPSKTIIFCSKHTKFGEYAAVMSKGAWIMPWGDTPIDTELAERLKAACPFLLEDNTAHLQEHSIEVLLPFIQRFRPDFQFVPIALGHLTLDECRDLGEAVADTIATDAKHPLLVASSDMSHYEPDDVTRKKDRKAIDRILALDPSGLYRTVRSEHISMCGMIPTAVMIFAALHLGAKQAVLLKYATSGEVNRKFDQVVGYAGLAIL